MPDTVRCQYRSRIVVILGSAVLAFCGWVGMAWSWLDHGHAAGVEPGFIVAGSVGITFTITFCVSVVMPDQARIYGLGHRDGFREGQACAEAKRRHLTAV